MAMECESPLMLMGLPGVPNCECLSFSDLMERRESNLRTEDDRLPGVVGDCDCNMLGFKSPSVSFSLSEVPDGDDGNAPGTWFGVAGCDDSGPPLGVEGRDAGGVSSGAGMLVPSVREKETGVMVRGLKVGGAMFGRDDALRDEVERSAMG
jgi:hypothetical protein